MAKAGHSPGVRGRRNEKADKIQEDRQGFVPDQDATEPGVDDEQDGDHKDVEADLRHVPGKETTIKIPGFEPVSFGRISDTEAEPEENDEDEEDNQEGQGQEDEGGANKDLIGKNEEEEEGELAEDANEEDEEEVEEVEVEYDEVEDEEGGYDELEDDKGQDGEAPVGITESLAADEKPEHDEEINAQEYEEGIIDEAKEKPRKLSRKTKA
ncbi:hypothetical protein K469DRAFT_685456 [Zopfia rhizophila CBS 207.26]|uniref:Uncharacterized protein n=1 Tax=Zopfia rhizophila CBS 207.26 TaxID=1314779 RepID=A0A6A6E6I9_9PEZI|nr:hypothetical protein K469DRAFT_685456 [Zopfia rhizophila CBS 207.26]